MPQYLVACLCSTNSCLSFYDPVHCPGGLSCSVMLAGPPGWSGSPAGLSGEDLCPPPGTISLWPGLLARWHRNQLMVS